MIDPATGLPELPEGRRWSVGEERCYDSFSFYAAETGYLSIVLQEKTQVTDVTPHASFWHRQRVIRTERFEWRKVPGSEAVRIQGNHPIAVSNAAHRVLKQLAVWESREALKGIYPPNKLEVAS